jgi:hypothetical protein
MTDDYFEKRLAILETVGLTYHEYLMLTVPVYEPRRFDDAPGYARALAPCLRDLPNDQEGMQALNRIFARGLVQYITRGAIERIKMWLRVKPARGPMNGLPFVGQLDLTLEGFELWERIWQLNHPGSDFKMGSASFVYRERNKVVVFACTEWRACSEAANCGFKPISSLEAIGPWRSNWWCVHPEGYSLRCIMPEET